MLYRVWDKYNEKLEDATEIDSDNISDAIKEWVENNIDRGVDTDIIIQVLEENGKYYDYTIRVKYVPEITIFDGE